MSNSYRIRTQVGVDKSINVHLEQDFEFLEILSIKILESDIYTRQCSDYGVVIGRISINNGFGVPNCKVSIFVPLSSIDANNPIISDLYPYSSVSDLNDLGYRYNLLPYVRSYSNHVPTGSFFDKEDVLLNQSYIEVFDKYYRYTAVTNESGDFMIFGVPLGTQTIHVDIDLSDIGEFSLAPQDLIRTGLATETQVSGTKFKSSSNLNELPQIISINRIITVEPLWGQPDICNIGINRTDFDLSAETNVVIQPAAIFMGSMFSDVDNLALKSGCKPKFAQGELCSLVAGPGEILAIRQTIFNDDIGKPVLEQYELESGGQVIDDNGTWLVDLPMNLDYVTTNEFGERVFSNDPEVGIPTRGKYRFKIKWNQSPSLDENVKRAYFLVPNIREYVGSGSFINPILQKKSYAFSLSWDDYADPQSAIDCEDTFYQFSYNKVYTVSQLIDQYRKGTLANRIISIKNILDNTCESTNNKFPTNDASFRWDFIYLLYTFASYIFKPILVVLVTLLHFFYFLVGLIRLVLLPILIGYVGYIIISVLQFILFIAANPIINYLMPIYLQDLIVYVSVFAALTTLNILFFKIKFKGINLPLLLYDQCEFCKCDDGDESEGNVEGGNNSEFLQSFPPQQNASGIQITNFEGGAYNLNQFDTDINYAVYNQLITGYFVQFGTNRVRSYSKVPASVNAQYQYIDDDGNPQYGKAQFFTRSITLAERFNLFNVKSKYFDGNPITNPGGGVNQVYVSVEPILNGGGYTYNGNGVQPYLLTNTTPNYHTDNVIVMMMTPESLPLLSGGTILSFVNPNSTKDINYSGASLNIYNTNSISGESIYASTTTPTVTINVAHILPDGSPRTTQYTIPKPNSGNTNYHKFPTDIEYFQVITAMTYSNFAQIAGAPSSAPFLDNSFWLRVLGPPMEMNVKFYTINNDPRGISVLINPLTSLEDYDKQIIVILNRGVDPYSTRVNIKYDLGRIFGRQNPTFVSVQGSYKLNIPVQGGFKNVRHSAINTQTTQDPYSLSYLFYPTFDYNPLGFSAYSSNLTHYYSSFDSSYTLNSAPNNNGSLTQSPAPCQTDVQWIYDPLFRTTPTPDVITVNIDSIAFYPGQNEFIYYYDYFGNGLFRLDPNDPNIPTTPPLTPPDKTRGYYRGEIVEGGSMMSIMASLTTLGGSGFYFLRDTAFSDPGTYEYKIYIGPMYFSGITTQFISSPNRRYVMRSDRLPTSDRLLETCGISYSLQQNQNFAIYIIPDEGAFEVPANTGGSSGIVQDGDNNNEEIPNFTFDLLQSTNKCSDSRNLACYEFEANEPIRNSQLPGGGRYIINEGDCQKFKNKKIFDNGCYKLVTKVLTSLPEDIRLIIEWVSRTNITFGACRNVFSHLFTQNWVNGTLYAFAFKNNKFFDSNNNVEPNFCRNTIYYEEDTNNFYYRSSPFRTGLTNNGFIGIPAPNSTSNKNLLFPTTIMDLGPRSDYIQELVFSDEYDGYVVNRINSTSYQDVSEILNILIITRLLNTSYRRRFRNPNVGGNIFNYFSRDRLTVDADYAQMISINSELGVVPFEAENYPSIDTNSIVPPLLANQFVIDPVYFNTGSNDDVIFGIFYSSDTQLRDYITPKRTIINSQGILNSNCTFNNFYCYSQEVPFYQWEITPNNDTSPNNSIFGSQKNDWYRKPINQAYFHRHKYQSLDRANRDSRYFRTNTSQFANDYKGYIYSIDNPTVPTPPTSPFYTQPSLNPLSSSWDKNNPNFDTITVGAPFYFYFGLKKGASAWDRFAKKWINFERIQ